MKTEYIELKDKTKIYTMHSLGKDADTLIIVHGGPGNGFYDQIPFMKELAKKYNVLAFDERGVNKSDAINDNFTSEMLVDDIEEIREYFNIDKAILIGHSYGGRLLMRYCLKYPSHIKKAIFMCPSFDFVDSIKTVCQRSVDLLENRDFEKLDEIKEWVKTTDHSKVLDTLMMIPEDVQSIVYGYNRVSEDIMKQISQYAPNEDELIKSGGHQQAVFSEGELLMDKIELLKEINVPTLLIVGDGDPVCSPLQTKKYRDYVKDGKVEYIKNSGHFPYMDSIKKCIEIIERSI